ncbi:MAG: tetratricopeptide repeat protein [Chloroflexota bacterium]
MSDISLNQYIEQIDSMLEDRRYEEAVFHCRHILQQLPKNIAAYRRLGRALITLNRWQEAGEILRRILSVAPDDRVAHLSLSRTYHHLKQPDLAIWHLERAWEHEPNNPTLSEELREMYAAHRGVDNPRLQLTTGAAARLYARNGLYDQAVSVLIHRLKTARDRVDLRLLLARIQREGDRQLDAAETALSVLAVLPDCLEANYILADLWLGEQRPSDAQRYLSRIEPVDPYAALKLAQGYSAPDDAVGLMYGDFEKAAASEMVEAQPDWLTDLNTEAVSEPSTEDLESLFEEGTETAFADLYEEDLDEVLDVDDDWLDEIADEDPAAAPEVDERLMSRSTGRTGLLAVLNQDEKPEEEQPVVPETAAPIMGDTSTDEDDPLAWLDSDEVADLEFDMDETDEAALDWLAEESEANAEEVSDAPPQTAPAADPSDPMAWLRGSGVELLDEDEAGPARLSRYAAEDDDMQFQDPEKVDPMAWLRGSGVELVEEEGPDDPQGDDLFGDVADDKPSEAQDEDTDPMAWLKESGVELVEEDETGPSMDLFEDGPEPEARSMTAQLSDDTLLDEMLEMEALASGEDYEPTTYDIKATRTPGEEGGDALMDLFGDVEEEGETMPDKDNDNMPDWLNASEDDEETGAEEWLDGEPFDSQPSSADRGEQPDWLSGFEEDTEAEDDEAEAGVVEPGLFGDVEGEYNWSGPVDADEEPFAESTPDTPDWQMRDEEGEDEEDELDWLMSEQEADEDEEEFAFEADEAPDWLSDISRDEAPAQPEPAPSFEAASEDEEDELDWLMSEQEADEDEEEFAFEADEAPDWLSDISRDEAPAQPEPAPSFGAESEDEETDWLLEEEEAFAFEEEEVPEADMPDWLSEDDAAFEAEEADEDLPDWLIEMEGAEETAEPTLATGPEADYEWMEQAELVEANLETETPVAEAVAAGEETAAAPADNAPDWLNAMVPGLDLDYQAREDAPIEQSYLSETYSEDAAREGADADFQWLVNIVDEESGKPPEVSLENMPGMPQPKREPRFTFSRPPAWLRGNRATGAAQSAPAQVMANEDEDIELGEELPPWLTGGADAHDEFKEAFDSEPLLDEDDDDFLFDDELFDDTNNK